MSTPVAADWFESGYVEGFNAGIRYLEDVIADTQANARDRALQALAARDAGVVIPGVAA